MITKLSMKTYSRIPMGEHVLLLNPKSFNYILDKIGSFKIISWGSGNIYLLSTTSRLNIGKTSFTRFYIFETNQIYALRICLN